MKLGVLLPHGAVRTASDLRQFAEVVEGAGLRYVAAYDHILGAEISSRPDWSGPYTSADPFHELFVVFAFLSAITHLELVSGVLVLPQRQAPLVAKQAAELSILAPGRFRLGVGAGWNHVEYSAMNEDFHTRGARLEEQVQVLRLLWSQQSVDFKGRFHQLDRVGINPLPPETIPIWMGGAGHRFTESVQTERVLDRIGRIADGWIAGSAPEDQLERSWLAIVRSATSHGRDPRTLGFQAAAEIRSTADVEELCDRLGRLKAIGATHVTLITARKSTSLEEHCRIVQVVGEALSDATAD